MAELADAHGLGPCAERRAGSSPVPGTMVCQPIDAECRSRARSRISENDFQLVIRVPARSGSDNGSASTLLVTGAHRTWEPSRCTLGILSHRFETTKLCTRMYSPVVGLTINHKAGVVENPCQTARQTLGKVVLCSLSPRNQEPFWCTCSLP